jgi:outer membrane protein assembly factor BamB
MRELTSSIAWGAMLAVALASCSGLDDAVTAIQSAQCTSGLGPRWLVSQPTDDPTAKGSAVTTGIATDPNGALFVTGSFFKTVRLARAASRLTSKGSADVFVAGLDPSSGSPLWIKTAGDEREQFAAAVAANSGGKVGIVGSFAGTLSFGGTAPSLRSGSVTPYLAGLSAADGKGLFAVRLELPGGSALTSIAADPLDGNFVVCGSRAASAHHSEVFVQKVDATSGATIWDGSSLLASRRNQKCNGVAVDGAGAVVLTGVTNDDVYLVKLQATAGTVSKVFERTFIGDVGQQTGSAVTTDANNDLAITGSFVNHLTFDHRVDPTKNVVVSSTGAEDLFVAKLSGATGDPSWVRASGGPGVQRGAAIASATRPGPSFFVTGEDQQDLLLLQLGPDGAVITSERHGDLDHQEGTALATSGDSTYLLGLFRGAVSFRGPPPGGVEMGLSSPSGFKSLVAKLGLLFNCEGPPPPPQLPPPQVPPPQLPPPPAPPPPPPPLP